MITNQTILRRLVLPCWLFIGMSSLLATQSSGSHPQAPTTPTGPMPELESYPGAAAVLYLDFDGEIIQNDPYWHPNSPVNPTNPINAAASGLTTEQIRQAYEVVKEDFLPFNINVTTKRSVYDARASWPKPMRMRAIVTPTDDWYLAWQGQIAGDGYSPGYGAFRQSGTGLAYPTTPPFFVFLNDWSGNTMTTSAVEIGCHISHEAGHTFGLLHDGWRYPADNVEYTGVPPKDNLGVTRFNLYFFGDGSGPGGIIAGLPARLSTWTPIMGANFRAFLSQWSAGGVINGTSNNDCISGFRSYWGQEFDETHPQYRTDGVEDTDDVAVLGATGPGTNNFGFRTTEPDTYPDHGGSIATATALPVQQSGAFQGYGIISRTASGGTDEDFFRIELNAPASVSFLIKPAEPFTHIDPATERELNAGVANLYMTAHLQSSSGMHVATLNPGSETCFNPANPTERGSAQTTEFLRRRLTIDLGAGIYHLRIAPSSFGNPFAVPTGVNLGSGSNPLYKYTPSTGFVSAGSMGAYSIEGNVVYTIPAITSPLVAAGVVSQSFTPYQATATPGPVTWMATGLPPGLDMNNAGLITGTPSAQGTFNVTLRASTAAAYGEATLVITITTPAPPTIISASSLLCEEGQPFTPSTYRIVATGGATSYNVIGGAVPGLGVNPTTGVITGTPTTPGVINMTVSASNSWGTGTLVLTVTVRPSPATALDNTLIGFTRPDAVGKQWFGQTAIASDGTDAMQSPALGHNEQASIETNVTGPGAMDYFWRADTEPGDVLSLRIDGTVYDSVSGNVGWTSRSISVPAGAHTLRWNFARNASGSGGSDTVWLDRVVWTGASGPTITSPLTVNWTCGQISQVYLTSNDPATVWTMGGTLPSGAFFIGNPTSIIGASLVRPGVHIVTLYATNAQGTTTRAFTIQAESAYTAWARNNGLAAGSELADGDNDGLASIAELAFALDPFVADQEFQPVTFDAPSGRLRASFRRQHQYYPDITYEVESSGDLMNWTAIARSTNGGSFQNLGGAQSITETQVGTTSVYNVLVIDGSAWVPGLPRRFLRVKIKQE